MERHDQPTRHSIAAISLGLGLVVCAPLVYVATYYSPLLTCGGLALTGALVAGIAAYLRWARGRSARRAAMLSALLVTVASAILLVESMWPTTAPAADLGSWPFTATGGIGIALGSWWLWLIRGGSDRRRRS